MAAEVLKLLGEDNMSPDASTDKILVLDALTHGLNISLFDLMSILSSQAPLSNLLVPALGLGKSPMSTLIPVPSINLHRHHHMPAAAPTARAYETAAAQAPPPVAHDEGLVIFMVVYWASLAFVVGVAVAAVLTKLTMSVHKSQSERKPLKATAKPMTDAERWCMRRQKMRDWEAEMREARDEAESRSRE